MSGKEKIDDKMNANGSTGSTKQNTGTQAGKNKTDYDSAWKEVIERLFEPFTGFFFPDIHQDIDFSRGIEILDSELRDIAPYGNVGKRYADELVKVHLKDGTLACVWVFIHIEVQGKKEKKGLFPERAYISTIEFMIKTSRKESKSLVSQY